MLFVTKGVYNTGYAIGFITLFLWGELIKKAFFSFI